MKYMTFFACSIALLGFAFCRLASAENEAIYYPNGKLYIPYVNLLDGSGNTITNYAAYLRKDRRAWKFTLYGLSTVAKSTNNVATNAATNVVVVSTNLAGTWNFTFHKTYVYHYGTNFNWTTNTPQPTPDIIPLTLTQSGEDITGTGTLNAVQYTLSGQIATDLFSFTMLSGYTNSTMALTSVHVAVGTNTMSGDYFASITNNLSAINSGAVTAIKQ